MTQKRYEISDEQGNQIKDLFPITKTGRPPKDNRVMFNSYYGLQEVALHGVMTILY